MTPLFRSVGAYRFQIPFARYPSLQRVSATTIKFCRRWEGKHVHMVMLRLTPHAKYRHCVEGWKGGIYAVCKIRGGGGGVRPLKNTQDPCKHVIFRDPGWVLQRPLKKILRQFCKVPDWLATVAKCLNMYMYNINNFILYIWNIIS